MKRPDEFKSLLDNSWKEFSATWKKARTRSSEKSVHDLRVSTRRLIAILELVRGLSKRGDIIQVQRSFKKVLKGMGPLRDVQVQLEKVSHLKQVGLVADFRRDLERRERREIEKIQSELRRGRRRRLTDAVKDVRSEFVRLDESFGDDRIRRSVDRVLAVRRNEFLKAVRCFRRLQPLDEEALHEMRIALKKLRYVIEAAQPVLGPSAKQRALRMHGFQQLMGDSRDVELLRTELEKWAKKKGRTIAIVPTLAGLTEKREILLKKVVESTNQLEKSLETKTPLPIETTYAIVTPVSASSLRV